MDRRISHTFHQHDAYSRESQQRDHCVSGTFKQVVCTECAHVFDMQRPFLRNRIENHVTGVVFVHSH